MKEASPFYNKTALRKEFRRLRQTISHEIREKISFQVADQFQNLNGLTLSFSSFSDEIDLWELNHRLAKNTTLVLPRVDDESLYLITDLSSQLIRSRLNILEPNPTKAEKVDPSQIATALVPGLAFDHLLNRLGYGQGFYDRLIGQFIQARKIGVGFTNQLSQTPLPIEPHDEPLDELALF